MIRSEWNALRVGDHVLVHDEADPAMPMVAGRVVTVRAASGSNDVAIRIRSGRGRSRIAHPRRLAVHREELDPDGHCWRCDANAASDNHESNQQTGTSMPDKSPQRPAGKKPGKSLKEKREAKREKEQTKRTIPT